MKIKHGIAAMLLSSSMLLCSCSASNAKYEMRDIDVADLVAEMKVGWNLGNTLDAPPGETAWGNPVTTPEMIDTVAEAGFNTIRIPTTWANHFVDGDDENEYKIDEEWMNRVTEVVDYAFDNNMYVILNSHHETTWIKPTMEKVESILPKFKSMWTQIAEHFKDYGDHLLFEGLNEPRIEGGKNEWNGGTADGREALNILNKAFVETVRATGGKNENRALLITSFAAAVAEPGLKDLEIPDDPNIIVSLHAYTPYDYTYNIKKSYEKFIYDESVVTEIDRVFDLIDKYFTSKDIPVIITEFGSMSKHIGNDPNNIRNDKENVKWVKSYLGRAKESKIPCVLWDNGYYTEGNELFGVLNRSDCSWFVPDLVEAMMSVYSEQSDAQS